MLDLNYSTCDPVALQLRDSIARWNSTHNFKDTIILKLARLRLLLKKATSVPAEEH